jgi:hypothetical protein
VTEHPDSPAPVPSSAPAEPSAGDARQVSLRRAPRYRAFVLTGLVVGLAVAGLLYVLYPGGAGNFSARAVFGYVAAALGLVGSVLGGLAAVLVERPRKR